MCARRACFILAANVLVPSRNLIESIILPGHNCVRLCITFVVCTCWWLQVTDMQRIVRGMLARRYFASYRAQVLCLCSSFESISKVLIFRFNSFEGKKTFFLSKI